MLPWKRAEQLLRGGLATLRTRAVLHACDVVKDGAFVAGVPFVDNRGRIEIGEGSSISSLPVRSHLATRPGASLVIGDRVRIAHGAAIYVASEVVVGDDVAVGPMSMILDVDFHEIGDRSASGTPRPIRIGRGVRLAVGCVVLRGVVIGDGARIGPHSVVARSIPPGVYAEGVPARPVNA